MSKNASLSSTTLSVKMTCGRNVLLILSILQQKKNINTLELQLGKHLQHIKGKNHLVKILSVIGLTSYNPFKVHVHGTNQKYYVLNF